MSSQLERVEEVLSRGAFMTLAEIAALTRDPEASISARIRELRSMGFEVERDGPLGRMKPARYRIKPHGDEA
jgi:biotin operon repressor